MATRKPIWTALVFHPELGGFLRFDGDDYALMYATADDFGNERDMSPAGFLKSRTTICHGYEDNAAPCAVCGVNLTAADTCACGNTACPIDNENAIKQGE
jgi:hypothetical protein